jgi:2,3-bisphosphoglycerate-independent phosphoglycerate mutase
LEALGIHFEVGPRDVAVRGNFITVDEGGVITDRRAGRPPTERCVAMCRKLQQIRVPDVEVFVEPVREHRFVVVFRGDNLGDAVNDTDPQQVGHKPLPAQGADPNSQRTAQAVNQFVAEAARVLKGDAPTNMVTLRGFARYPKIDTMREVYGVKPVAIAVYPMYKGLARLVGMEVADAGATLTDQVDTLRRLWNDYDFFFLHYKYTDSTGEDGNFTAKVEMIERLDAELPKIRALGPDVLIVTGDHSTPSKLKSHSWHPVPTLLWARTCRPDPVTEFGESYCLRGGLGQFQAMYLLPMALAHAGRLGKYGA